MKLKVVMILAVCFCFMSLVSAATILEIQTLPDHEIFITEIDAYASGDHAVTSPLRTFTGKYGKLELEYFPQKSTFKLGLLLKDDAKTAIKYKILEDNFHEEETISLTFLPNGIELEDVLVSIEKELLETIENTNLTETNVSESNISENNETEEIVEPIIEDEVEEVIAEVDDEIKSNESSEGIFKGILMSGHSVYENNKLIVNLISYIFGAVILIGPLYMLFKRRKGKKGSLIPGGDTEEEAFEKAETDLKKARDKIDELKGKKIDLARKKLIEDEKELLRLRKLGKD